MFNLFLLLNFASLIAFIVGLINPKLILRGDNRTRRKSSEIYLSAFVFSFIGMLVFVPKPEPAVVVTATRLRLSEAKAASKEVKPTPTPTQTPHLEVKPSPIPTPTPTLTPTREAKAFAKPTPEFVAFEPSVCKTDAYLPVNGASIALYTTCQYLNTYLIKPESVSVVTGANDKNNNDVSELMAESGFEGVTWRDYTLDPESKRDVCVEYKDESVSCFTFSDPNQTAGVQIQPQDTANIPTGASCGNFATQADAQAANTQLDRDGDGTQCDSLTNQTGGSYVHSGSSGSYQHTRRRRRKR
jgi:hypothetical protein